MPTTPLRTITIRMLGGAEVVIDGNPVTLRSRRAHAVLALVVLRGGRQSREWLASQLWADSSRSRALANLRVVLSELSAHLGACIEVERDVVTWAHGGDATVDVVELRSAIGAATDLGRWDIERIAHARRAVELAAAGPLLPGFERLVSPEIAWWLEAEREALAQATIEVNAGLVELLLGEGRALEAVKAARGLVALDEYREASHVALTEAHLAADDPIAAIRQLERCHATIVDDLGLAPGPDLLAMADKLGVSIGGSDVSIPRLVVPRMLPLPPRRVLYGRVELLASLAARDRLAGDPLVTLTGPGGVGKTSLAVSLAHRWRDEGRDVVFVDLTHIADAGDVPGAVTAAFGATGSYRDGIEQLSGLIGEREVRVVLDNVEHLVDAAIGLGELLAACPELTIIATSRIPLRLRDERIVEVPSLAVPDGVESVEAIASSGAVRLFQQRAADAGADVSDDDLGAVARIVRLLGGLPLAIELAAPRRRHMGADGLAAELEKGIRNADLSLVGGGPIDLPERHRSLRAALASSVDLLDADELGVFAAASVFDGPFTSDAASALVDLDEVTLAGAVTRLADLHLVRTEQAAPLTWYSMLPAVRAMAASALSNLGRTDSTVARLIDHDVGLVESAAPGIQSPDDRWWIAVLDRYYPTLRRTLDRLHDADDARELPTVVAIAPYWFERGRFAEGTRRLLCVARPTDPAGTRSSTAAEARLWAAMMHAESIGYALTGDVVDDVLEALDTIRSAVPPPTVMLRTLLTGVHVFDHARRNDLAAMAIDEARSLAASAGEPWLGVKFVYAEAMLAHTSGDDERCTELLRIAIADADLLDNRTVLLHARMLADLIGVAGPAGGTTITLSDLLDLAIEVGDQRQVVWLTVSLGAVAFMDGDSEAAAAYFIDALTLSRNANYFLGIAYCLMGGTAIALSRGDIAAALEFHGAIEVHLDFLARSMPRAYSEPYRDLVPILLAAEAADAALDGIRARAAIAPQSAVLADLSAHLVGVAAAAADTAA